VLVGEEEVPVHLVHQHLEGDPRVVPVRAPGHLHQPRARVRVRLPLGVDHEDERGALAEDRGLVDQLAPVHQVASEIIIAREIPNLELDEGVVCHKLYV